MTPRRSDARRADVSAVSVTGTGSWAPGIGSSSSVRTNTASWTISGPLCSPSISRSRRSTVRTTGRSRHSCWVLCRGPATKQILRWPRTTRARFFSCRCTPAAGLECRVSSSPVETPESRSGNGFGVNTGGGQSRSHTTFSRCRTTVRGIACPMRVGVRPADRQSRAGMPSRRSPGRERVRPSSPAVTRSSVLIRILHVSVRNASTNRSRTWREEDSDAWEKNHLKRFHKS